MAQHNLPAGCHDADSAALLLGMSKKALLKRMRELGWLTISKDKRNHNLPRHEYTRLGYLTVQERGYGLRGKMEISKTYQVMLLTQIGFQALKKALSTAPTIATSTTPEPAKKIQFTPAPPEPTKPYNREASTKAHDEFFKEIASLLDKAS